jgi:thiol-disulfide isomerase/thioredoxin
MKVRVFLANLFMILLPTLAFSQATVEFSFKNVSDPGQQQPAIGYVNLDTNEREIVNTKNGTADVTFPQGLYKVTFTAGGLRSTETILVVDQKYSETLKADVFLRGWNFDQDVNLFFAIGNFNNFNVQKAVELEQNGSTYTGTLPNPEGELVYQLATRTMDVHYINGTQYDKLSLDRDLTYLSHINTKKKEVSVTFDLSKLADNTKSGVEFQDSETTIAQSAAYGLNVQEDLIAYEKEAIEAAKMQTSEVDFDVEEQIRKAYMDFKTSDSKLITELAAHRTLNLIMNLTENEHQAIINDLATTLDADSYLWKLEPSALFMFSQAEIDQQILVSVAEKLQDHPSDQIKQSSLFFLLSNAFDTGKMEKAEDYFSTLTSVFPQSKYAEYAKQYYNPNQAIISGKDAPDFEITSLDFSKEYHLEDFEGKYVMLDFWATWCGPCLQEMDELHEVYEEFSGENFTILSLSFDDNRETVTDFRENKYDMPWDHAFVENGFNNPLAQAYEVTGIPKPILIGPDGKIKAVGTQLRGKQLSKTLETHLK